MGGPLASSELAVGAEDLLARIAAPTPAPGAGAAAALACGLAAALVEKACAVALGHEHPPAGRESLRELRERAAASRARAPQLADEDAAVYEQVIDALRRPHDDPARAERVAAALSQAAAVPLAIAAEAAAVTEAGAGAAALVRAPLGGEAVAGVLLAEAASRAAAALVVIDLEGHPDDARVARAGELARRAAAGRERAEEAIR